jgi:hypothetical protein
LAVSWTINWDNVMVEPFGNIENAYSLPLSNSTYRNLQFPMHVSKIMHKEIQNSSAYEGKPPHIPSNIMMYLHNRMVGNHVCYVIQKCQNNKPGHYLMGLSCSLPPSILLLLMWTI